MHRSIKIYQIGQETGSGVLPVSRVSLLAQVHQGVQMSQRILKLERQQEGAHESETKSQCKTSNCEL